MAHPECSDFLHGLEAQSRYMCRFPALHKSRRQDMFSAGGKIEDLKGDAAPVAPDSAT